MATFTLHCNGNGNDTVPRDLNVAAPPSVSSSNLRLQASVYLTEAMRVEAFGRPVRAGGGPPMCNTQQSGEEGMETEPLQLSSLLVSLLSLHPTLRS